MNLEISNTWIKLKFEQVKKIKYKSLSCLNGRILKILGLEISKYDMEIENGLILTIIQATKWI